MTKTLKRKLEAVSQTTDELEKLFNLPEGAIGAGNKSEFEGSDEDSKDSSENEAGTTDDDDDDDKDNDDEDECDDDADEAEAEEEEDDAESSDDDDDDDDDDESSAAGSDSDTREDEEGTKSKPVKRATAKGQHSGELPVVSEKDEAEVVVKGKRTKDKGKGRAKDKHRIEKGEEEQKEKKMTQGSAEPSDDSSDEEDIRNTIGNIPMEWFRDFDHIGYNILGQKIIKPDAGDEIDDFLEKNDNPDYWRTVRDRSTGQKVILSDEDVALVKSLVKGKYSNAAYDPYKPWIDFFTNETMIHPVTNQPEHKRSFIPSKWEKKRVGELVAAIKLGRIKPQQEKKREDEMKFYDLWANAEQSEVGRRYRHHIPAPPKPAPGHAESYNPPPEYLFTKDEEKTWKEQEPEERRTNFVPSRYSSLRLVPGYAQYFNELFERCLDLYLCPRQRRVRVNVNPEELIPKLPKPKDLQPFPTTLSLVYKGHTGAVRCLSIDPTGQWLVSGSQDCSIRLWEVSTGRCMRNIKVAAPVKDIAWNPNSSISVITAAVGNDILVLNSQLGDHLVVRQTDDMLSSFQPPADADDSDKKLPAEWNSVADVDDRKEGLRVRISHSKVVNQIVWHRQGDYFAAVVDSAGATSVVIHRLSKRQSQRPFSSLKGDVQCVQFHPSAPHFFVATKIAVRKYNLLKQELSKKLFTNCRWVSSMAVHPRGDHIVIGSYDRKLSWFDLDLSNKPYQTLKNHSKAIRQVCYHKRYPLFASGSADGSVIVYHGRVYDDLMQNPTIVPVKILRCHSSMESQDIGVLDCEFHPSQPWIFTCGADNTVKLFT